MSSNIQVLAVLFSEEDLLRKIDALKQQGYSEEDLHLMAEDEDRFERAEQRTHIEIEETGGFSEKFKGIFGKGGVKALDLTDEDKKRYLEDLEKGGILVYVDQSRDNISEVIHAGGLRDREGNPIEPSSNEFVNSVDNNFDEQEDRFARGESFQHDPNLVVDEHHVSFTTQQKPEVEKARGGMTESERHSSSDKKYK
ncbi:general stress protein [Planococcus sp. APC 3906]|uniref:general stress protein n=1 Tax=Planococcus sp. APC 3906 TaxID=3035194 RepID=UPI0025B411D8|nr:general stress protein [Planococcus sp. APC 3906]MDN3450330.1 general stress protein [Planococcus sp. APC 3906]